MPNRILRDFTDSDLIDALDVNAERFFVRLIMKVDDYGRYYSDERLLKSALFPLKTDIRVTDITRWVTACEKSGIITTYEVANKRYLEIANFNQQLRIKKSKFPENQSINNDTQTHSIRTSSANVKGNEVETETETEDETESEGDLSIEVLNFLNETANKNFQPVESNLKFIRARLKEQPAEILKQVIQLKTFEWKDDFKMNDFLRPETLFNATKFQTYIQKVHEVKQNPQKFKKDVEQRNSENRKSAAKHYDPLDAMSD